MTVFFLVPTFLPIIRKLLYVRPSFREKFTESSEETTQKRLGEKLGENSSAKDCYWVVLK